MKGIKWDEEMFKNFTFRNKENISITIQDTLSKFGYTKGKTLLSMDFDECVVNTHLSGSISDKFQHRYVIPESDLRTHDFRGLCSLVHCFFGLNILEIESEVDNVSNTILKPDFLDFYSDIKIRKNIFPVFISSGLEEAIARFFRNNSIQIPVIGTSLLKDKNSNVQYAHKIIDDKTKGMIAASLFKKGDFAKMITIGHGRGDVSLINSGTAGLRFSLRDNHEAMKSADHVIDKFTELLLFL